MRTASTNLNHELLFPKALELIESLNANSYLSWNLYADIQNMILVQLISAKRLVSEHSSWFRAVHTTRTIEMNYCRQMKTLVYLNHLFAFSALKSELSYLFDLV